VRRGKKGRPGYLFRSVTSEAKAAVPVEGQLALDLADPVVIEKRSRGFSWGTVVHGALAAMAGGLDDAELRAVGRGLLLENERPLDAHGEPTELDELVNSVYSSSLWERARGADEIVVEVPFSTRVPTLESTGDPGHADVKRYVECVIDLAFRGADGWTIADYKTDIGTDPEFPLCQTSYRRQVELYAACWTRLTEAPIKERIILYTAQLREETW